MNITKSYRKSNNASSYHLVIQAGRGGNGLVGLCYKSNAKGLPNGGNGGRGGHVYLQLDKNLHTLSLVTLPSEKGINGYPGERDSRHGSHGKDMYIMVPEGTRAYHRMEDGEEFLLGSVSVTQPTLLIAKGGKGGHGNWHDHNCESKDRVAGLPGGIADLILKHVILSDILVLGPVNSGKSLLFNKLIQKDISPSASYPYTTQKPILGSLQYYSYQRPLIVLDTPANNEDNLPTLITGAPTLVLVFKVPEDVLTQKDLLDHPLYKLVFASTDISEKKVYIILNTDKDLDPEVTVSNHRPSPNYKLYACNLLEPKLSLSTVITSICKHVLKEAYSRESIVPAYQRRADAINIYEFKL